MVNCDLSFASAAKYLQCEKISEANLNTDFGKLEVYFQDTPLLSGKKIHVRRRDIVWERGAVCSEKLECHLYAGVYIWKCKRVRRAESRWGKYNDDQGGHIIWVN